MAAKWTVCGFLCSLLGLTCTGFASSEALYMIKRALLEVWIPWFCCWKTSPSVRAEIQNSCTTHNCCAGTLLGSTSVSVVALALLPPMLQESRLKLWSVPGRVRCSSTAELAWNFLKVSTRVVQRDIQVLAHRTKYDSAAITSAFLLLLLVSRGTAFPQASGNLSLGPWLCVLSVSTLQGSESHWRKLVCCVSLDFLHLVWLPFPSEVICTWNKINQQKCLFLQQREGLKDFK